jgi:hypothetical protein
LSILFCRNRESCPRHLGQARMARSSLFIKKLPWHGVHVAFFVGDGVQYR